MYLPCLLQITLEDTCFQFQSVRWFAVANVSTAHIVNTFEYAETGVVE